MSAIYVVRHGQDEDNFNGILNGHRDTPLTEIGLAQAVTLAKAIVRHGLIIDQILCSPLRRAQQTAQIIANTLQLPQPTVVADLIERDFGALTGQPVSALVEHGRTDKSETFPKLLERANRVLTELQIKYEKQNLLVVTHGDLGKMLYASYYRLPWHQVLERFYFGNAELIELSPESSAERAVLIEVNQY